MHACSTEHLNECMQVAGMDTCMLAHKTCAGYLDSAVPGPHGARGCGLEHLFTTRVNNIRQQDISSLQLATDNMVSCMQYICSDRQTYATAVCSFIRQQVQDSVTCISHGFMHAMLPRTHAHTLLPRSPCLA